MTLDVYKSMAQTDGEAITFGDINDAQRFLAARLTDQFFEKLIGSPTTADPEFGSQNGANATTVWAYALSIGGAHPKQGSANNKVKIGAGTLFQKLASADGNEPTIAAFTFDGTLEVTIANGSAVNPRVDMIQMKLEYVAADVQSRDFQDATTGALSTITPSKKRQIQCTVSVKQGAVAASPTYPTPDAGYVPIAAVVVGTNYVAAAGLVYVDTAGAVAVLHDLRMPLRIRPHSVAPTSMIYNPAEGTARATTTIAINTMISTDNIGGAPSAHHVMGPGYWQINNNANPIYFPIAIPYGAKLEGYVVTVKKQDTTNPIAFRLVYQNSIDGEVAIGAGTATGTTAGTRSWGETGLGITVRQETHNFGSPFATTQHMGQYALKITPGGTATPAADYIDGVAVIYSLAAGDWVLQAGGLSIMAGNGGATMYAKCPTTFGRLVALSTMTASGAPTVHLVNRNQSAVAALSDLSSFVSFGDDREMKMADLEAAAMFAAGPVVQGNGTHAPPIWCNGKRSYEEGFSLASGPKASYDWLAIQYGSAASFQVYSADFYVAEGL